MYTLTIPRALTQVRAVILADLHALLRTLTWSRLSETISLTTFASWVILNEDPLRFRRVKNGNIEQFEIWKARSWEINDQLNTVSWCLGIGCGDEYGRPMDGHWSMAHCHIFHFDHQIMPRM